MFGQPAALPKTLISSCNAAVHRISCATRQKTIAVHRKSAPNGGDFLPSGAIILQPRYEGMIFPSFLVPGVPIAIIFS
jgi:hypothetical protein